MAARPWGAINDTVVRVSNGEGYHVVGWAVGNGTILRYSSTQPPRRVYLPVVLRR